MSKILYVASNMTHINNFHLPYVEKLREEGNEVLIMASGEGADFNIPFVKKMLSMKNLFSGIKIKKIIKTNDFDVIILNTTLAAFHVRRVLKKNKRPKVINIVHGYLFSEQMSPLKRKLLLFCEKILTKKTDSIIVMNSEDYTIACENKLSLGEVRSIKGMGARVAEPEVSVETVRRYTGTENDFVIGFVGELSERKCQRFLICALPEIKINIPNAELVFVGDGSQERELRELTDKLTISDSVHFMGNRSNPCDFIRAIDLYVSASLIEGMPFNVIEALGCGKTPLCSDIKGHRDLIVDGENGFLYRHGDTSDFVSKVKSIYDGELTASKETALSTYSEYSFDNVFNDTYATIKELCL